jgi:signal transduction histidine kinase/integral membrane sensor domain MASE1
MGRGREAAWLAAIAAAYFAAGLLGLRMAFVHQSASAVWPPTGIALAAVMLRGPRVWPAIFVPAFLVNQTTAGSVFTSLAIATGNTLEALVAARLVRTLADGVHALESPRRVLRFAAAAAAGAVISATVGVGSLLLLRFAALAQAPVMWLTWWLGDLSGALLVTPVVVLWALRPRWDEGPARLAEVGLLAVLVVTCSLLVFGPFITGSARGSPIAFLCLPPLVWAAFRFGPRETVTATALTCAIAIAGTLHGLGPYGPAGPRLALVLLQGYGVVTALMVLALAAAVAEQESAHKQIHDRDAQALSEAQSVAHIGSWSWDIASDTVTWSDELFRIYGLAPGSVKISYDTFLSTVDPADRARVDETVRRSFASGEPFVFDHRIVRLEGTQRWLHARGRVVMGPQGPVRMVGTGQDVTEQRRATEAGRAFLANAAHELRTPLTSIMGLIDLIAAVGRAVNQPLLDEYCDMLRKQGVRARRLISGLLDVSRMEQGLLEINMQRVPVLEAVRRSADAVTQAAERPLHVDVPDGLAVQADPLRLEEALVNLLQNAYVHGGPCVGVAAVAAGDEVHLEVWDDGGGVPADLLPNLFEPFARGLEARNVEGSGLGLTIVRGLLQAQGGRAWYEPRQPRGARFLISLRRDPADVVRAS